ncbi:hypothetical protein SAMN05421747_101493 [Parapedobacter composti]|uniref:Lipoprotein n=1 Tax=Parapedobacter composti TaxID=623281 RepID=A0A1I1ECE3_9SPHI|nr:hypothetical protein [Parapedobacter composti]SFB84781.1 hypothetical protein SAMN05421747_101493 [Parapedobacter composti]
MKMLKMFTACLFLAGITACGNTARDGQNNRNADSIYNDSIANDTATWGDTTMTTDSLASPSFP